MGLLLMNAPLFIQKGLAFLGKLSLRLMCVHIFVFYAVSQLIPSCHDTVAKFIKVALAILCAWLIGIAL